MYACACVGVCVYEYVFIHINTCVYMCAYVYVWVYISVNYFNFLVQGKPPFIQNTFLPFSVLSNSNI